MNNNTKGKKVQLHKFSQEIYNRKSVMWDRVNSLKIYRKISPAMEEWNAMFNKSELLKSCHGKEILKCAIVLAEADGVNHAILEIFFFTSP